MHPVLPVTGSTEALLRTTASNGVDFLHAVEMLAEEGGPAPEKLVIDLTRITSYLVDEARKVGYTDGNERMST